MIAIPGTKPLMSLNGEEINAEGSFEMPLQSAGSFSFSGTFNPVKGSLPMLQSSLPRKCEIMSGGLFRRRTFSFLADFIDFQNGEISGNIIGKLENRIEFTKLFNILVTVGYVLSCFGKELLFYYVSIKNFNRPNGRFIQQNS